jgi:hypothetical protein
LKGVVDEARVAEEHELNMRLLRQQIQEKDENLQRGKELMEMIRNSKQTSREETYTKPKEMEAPSLELQLMDVLENDRNLRSTKYYAQMKSLYLQGKYGPAKIVYNDYLDWKDAERKTKRTMGAAIKFDPESAVLFEPETETSDPNTTTIKRRQMNAGFPTKTDSDLFAEMEKDLAIQGPKQSKNFWENDQEVGIKTEPVKSLPAVESQPKYFWENDQEVTPPLELGRPEERAAVREALAPKPATRPLKSRIAGDSLAGYEILEPEEK